MKSLQTEDAHPRQSEGFAAECKQLAYDLILGGGWGTSQKERVKEILEKQATDHPVITALGEKAFHVLLPEQVEAPAAAAPARAADEWPDARRSQTQDIFQRVEKLEDQVSGLIARFGTPTAPKG